jgi:cytochrome c-type biogenesis protein CcmH/NrfG
LLLQVANFERDTRGWDAAVALYRQILQLNPNNLEARLSLAEVLTWQRQFDLAQQEVDVVLRSDPRNVSAQILAATIQVRRQTPESLTSAEQTLQGLLSNDPNNPQAGNVLGNS